MIIISVMVGYIIGLVLSLAYISYRDKRRFEVWLAEFTKMKKAETAEHIRRLMEQ